MASNAAGFKAMDDMIAAIKEMPNVARNSAPDVAREVKAQLDSTARAQQAPTGQAWAPRKGGGGPVLVNAPSHLDVKPMSDHVLITLTGPDVFHHYGAQDKPRRPIIPIKGLPFKLGQAVAQGVVEGWNRTVSKKYAGSGAKRYRGRG